MRRKRDYCDNLFIKQAAYSSYKSEWAACGLVSLWTALKLLGQNCIDPNELIDFSDDPDIAKNGATAKQLANIASEFGCKLVPFKYRCDFAKAWQYLIRQSEQNLPVILFLGKPMPGATGHAILIFGTEENFTYLMEPDDLRTGFKKITKIELKQYWDVTNDTSVFCGATVKPRSILAKKLFRDNKASL